MKIITRVALALLAVLLLLAGAAAYVLYNFDLNDHRDKIAAYLTRKAGAPVRIDGPIDVTLYPRLGVTARDLSIASTGEVEKRPLLKASEVVFALDPMALLDRKIIFHRIVLVKPEVAITLDENNTGNWEGLLRPEAEKPTEHTIAQRTEPAPHTLEDRTGRLFSGWLEDAELILSGFVIHDGIVRVRDDTIQEAFRFEHIEMQAGAGTEFPFDLTLMFRSESLQMRIAGHVRGTGIIDLDKPGIRLVGSRLDAEGEMPLLGEIIHATLTGSTFFDPIEETVSVKNAVFTTDEYVVRGDISGERIFRSNLLFSGTGHYTDRTRQQDPDDPDSLAPLEFTSDFALGIHSIKLTDLVANTPRNRVAPLTGTVDVWNFKGPRIRAELATEALDLDQVFGTPSPNPDAPGAGAPPVWLVPPGMARADLDMTLKADRVRTGDIATGPLTAHLDGRDGSVSLALEAEGLRGTRAPGPKGGRLARALQGASGRLQATATGNSTSWAALASSLRADLRLSLAGGTVDLGSRNTPVPLRTGSARLRLTGLPQPALQSGQSGNPLRNAPFKVLLDTALGGAESWNAHLGGEWVLNFGSPRHLQLPTLLSLTDAPAVVRFSGPARRMGLAWLAGEDAPVEVRANALAQLNNDTGVLRLNNVSMDTLGLTTRGSAEIRDLYSSPIAFGDAVLARFDPRVLLRRVGVEPPVMAAPDALSSAGATMLFQVDKKGARFDNLSVSVDNSTISGTVGLTDWDSPTAKFELATGDLNVDDYLPPRPEKPAHRDIPSEQQLEENRRKIEADKNAPPWDISWLRDPGFRLSGTLSATRLIWRELEYGKPSMALRMAPGELEMSPIRSTFYGGPLKASVRLRADDGLRLQVESSANGFDLDPVMRRFFDDDHIGGTGDLSVSLRTSGLNAYQLRRGLDGQANFTVTDGFYRFYGQNKPPAPMSADTPRDEVLTPPAPDDTGEAGGEAGRRKHLWSVEFSKAHGTIHAKNGVLSNDDFLMESLLARAQGKGQADIADQTADYVLNIQMTGIPTFPVHVHGTFDQLKTNIQAKGIVTDSVQRLGDSIFDIIGGAISLPFRAIDRVAKPLFGTSGDKQELAEPSTNPESSK